MMEQIDRDVMRTHPDMHFFSGSDRTASTHREVCLWKCRGSCIALHHELRCKAQLPGKHPNYKRRSELSRHSSLLVCEAEEHLMHFEDIPGLSRLQGIVSPSRPCKLSEVLCMMIDARCTCQSSQG